MIFETKGDSILFGNILSQKANTSISKEGVKLLSWNQQKKKSRNEVLLYILAGVIIMCTSLLLEQLFKVPTWTLWDGFLIFPLLAGVGALFVVTLPVGIVSWLLGLLFGVVREKPVIGVSVFSGVAVVLVALTYVMTMGFLGDIGFFFRNTHFYYDWSEIINLVVWCLISSGIGFFIYHLSSKNIE